MEKLKVGVIGLGGRGIGNLRTILNCDETDIVAVCDVYQDRCEQARDIVKERRGNTPTTYLDYTDLINDKEVECVVICSSWDEHTRMAVACMKAGKPVGVEVAGAYDLEDCWQLVRTYEDTKTPIMMLENCCYDKFELLNTSLARAGKFGKILYCSGAYAHELRGEILGGNVDRHYRLQNYRLRNCENYPTHEVGPIAKVLNICRGNKFIGLTSVATKGGYGLEEYTYNPKSPDPSLAGERFAQGDIVITSITCAGGEVVTIRLDTTLPRTYSREFILRGTKGMCSQDNNMVLIESDVNMHESFSVVGNNQKFLNSAEKYMDYLPDCWKKITEEEKALGHGGIDYICFKSFFDAVINKKEMPIDVYDMATWMAITPLSEQSIAHGGMPQAFPDFTRGAWIKRPIKDVCEMPTVEEKQSETDEKNQFGYSRK